MNEGISYPVEDKSIEPFSLDRLWRPRHLHGVLGRDRRRARAHGRSSKRRTTPPSASTASMALLAIAPQWDAQRGQFGYARRLRYVFFDQGGHVAIAKRYRAHAQKNRPVQDTRREAAREPERGSAHRRGERLVLGSRRRAASCKEMQAAGIERILWSNGQTPGESPPLNDLGVLTSRYDIYQDVMDPANFPSSCAARIPIGPPRPGRRTSSSTRTATGCAAGASRRRTARWFTAACICDQRALDYAAQAHPRGTGHASLSLPLHRHHHRRALARMLPPQSSHDPHREPRMEDGAARLRLAKTASSSPAARPATTPRCRSCTTSRA